MTAEYIETRRLWDSLRASEQQFFDARIRLIAQSGDLQRLVDSALDDPVERGAALRLLAILDESCRVDSFPKLVELAGIGHSDIELVRAVIRSLDAGWVASNIWPHIARMLAEDATDEEYRRYAELLREVDSALLMKLTEKAAASDDEDIREVANDFRRYSRKRHPVSVPKSSRKAVVAG